ncbi:MAG: sugar phosphate isomerase/epimerase family protein [Spirochaetota bacterium]
MKLAISGTEDVYKSSSITKLLDTARRYKLEYLEIWVPKNIQVEGLDRSVTLIKDSGLKVAAVSTWTHLFQPEGVGPQRDLLNQAIALAEQIEAPLVNTYFGHNRKQDDENAIATYADNLKPSLERAASRGITICLENEFDALGDDPHASDITRRPESIQTLMSRVGTPYFKLTFDPCNFYFAGVEPFPYAYEILKEYIGYVHLKDGTRYNPSLHENRGLKLFSDHSGRYICVALGQGGINYESLLARLKADGYRGFYTLEPHVEEKRLDDCYLQTLAYLRRKS